MWRPKNEEELQKLIPQGAIRESSSLDFKAEISSNNKEIAKDIAAMSTDGGVIIYGVTEDQDGRAVKLTPIPLKGAVERITAIANSSIHEPPFFKIDAIETQADPSHGYLVVFVPPSARAPHMVQVSGDNRFYGRHDGGNRLLGQGEVARLYERRVQWAQEPQGLLDTAIAKSQLEPHNDFGYLFLVAAPIVSDDVTFLNRALDSHKRKEDAIAELFQVSHLSAWKDSYPAFRCGDTKHSADGWKVFIGGFPEERSPRKVMDLELLFEGGARFTCGSAAERSYIPIFNEEKLILYEESIAQWTVQFLSFVGFFLERGGYFGPVTVGVAVTGIEDVVSHWMIGRHEIGIFHKPRYKESEYRRTARTHALELKDSPTKVAGQLLRRLFLSTTQGEYQPFT